MSSILITIMIIAGIVGYLLGSIPFAVIISRIYGVDIFKAGSGSPGATNVKRVLGKTAGNSVFFLDFLKGIVATAWPFLVLGNLGDNPLAILSKHDSLALYPAIIGFIAAVVGHNFSIFLKFRGGKGIATTMGGILILIPCAFLIGIALWIVVFYTTRYVSLASIIFGLSLPISALLLKEPKILLILSGILTVLIIIRHHSNIKRLIKGTEHKFAKPPKSEL